MTNSSSSKVEGSLPLYAWGAKNFRYTMIYWGGIKVITVWRNKHTFLISSFCTLSACPLVLKIHVFHPFHGPIEVQKHNHHYSAIMSYDPRVKSSPSWLVVKSLCVVCLLLLLLLFSSWDELASTIMGFFFLVGLRFRMEPPLLRSFSRLESRCLS